MRMSKFISIRTFFKASILIVASFLFAFFTFAASINLFPNSGTFNAGESFAVAVSVSSPDQAMNAISGTIAFPTDLLEVTSISRGGSIIQIWVREPSFSNATGSIQFEGVILNPGFQAASGNVITINFRAKSSGTAPVNFLSGSILANDGKGTSILSGLGGANFTIIGTSPPEITEPNAPEQEKPVPQASAPNAPVISSITHPDQTQWYAIPEAKIAWALPISITGVSYLIDQDPFTNPPNTNLGEVTSAEKTLTDGIWYIHVKLRNQSGWGEVSHFAIRVDTEAPQEFRAEIIQSDDLSNPRVKFDLSANDKTSGVQLYRLSIDGQEPIEWNASKTSSYYETPALTTGELIGQLEAIDYAGNKSLLSKEFTIESLPAPEIIDYHEELESGEPFYLQAKAFPNATIFIWVQESGTASIRWITRSDREGNLTFISDQGMRAGDYSIWLQAQDQRGALSAESEIVSIHVMPTGFTEFWQSNFRLLVMMMGIAWILFIIIIWYLLARFLAFKHRVRDDSNQALVGIHRAFNLLRDDLHNEVETMNTKTKKKSSLKIQKDLDAVEEYIEQKIHEIDDDKNQSHEKKKKKELKKKTNLKKNNK